MAETIEPHGERERFEFVVRVEYERFTDWLPPTLPYDNAPDAIPDRIAAWISEALPGALPDGTGDEAATLVASSVSLVPAAGEGRAPREWTITNRHGRVVVATVPGGAMPARDECVRVRELLPAVPDGGQTTDALALTMRRSLSQMDELRDAHRVLEALGAPGRSWSVGRRLRALFELDDAPAAPVEGDGRDARARVLDEARVAVNAAIYALFENVQLHSRAVAAAQLAADEALVELGAPSSLTAPLPEERELAATTPVETTEEEGRDGDR